MLTQQQKRFLKAKAHSLRPVILIGDKGITESLIAELKRSILHHELIKVRISGAERELRDLMITQLCEQTQAELVQRVGHIATLWKRNPNAPKIALI